MLARDRAGEKPLFYWHRDNTLVFASEIKSLLAYPAIGRDIDRTALAQYFLHGYFPSPRSVFAEIRKLPAAHRMVIRDGKVQIDAYWRLQDHLLPPGKPRVTARQEEHLVDELSQKLHEACVSRLVSDVPLGVFLSGGIDSSTLVAMMSELTPGNVNSFSVAFEEKSFNEEPYADFVARHFHTQHHVTDGRRAEPARGPEDSRRPSRRAPGRSGGPPHLPVVALCSPAHQSGSERRGQRRAFWRLPDLHRSLAGRPLSAPSALPAPPVLRAAQTLPAAVHGCGAPGLVPPAVLQLRGDGARGAARDLVRNDKSRGAGSAFCARLVRSAIRPAGKPWRRSSAYWMERLSNATWRKCLTSISGSISKIICW